MPLKAQRFPPESNPIALVCTGVTSPSTNYSSFPSRGLSVGCTVWVGVWRRGWAWGRGRQACTRQSQLESMWPPVSSTLSSSHLVLANKMQVPSRWLPSYWEATSAALPHPPSVDWWFHSSSRCSFTLVHKKQSVPLSSVNNIKIWLKGFIFYAKWIQLIYSHIYINTNNEKKKKWGSHILFVFRH